MSNIETFWNWFEQNNEKLTMLNDLEEKEQNELLKALQEQLGAYCEGLSYEMSEPGPTGRTLTLSAEGDTDLFRPLVELVDAAPDLDWWEFVAFKQPKGTDLKVVFDKYRFETKQMYFMPLENEVEPDIMGLRVALADANEEDEDQLVGVYVTIEALIGEFDCATLVGYMEVCALPKDAKKEGFQAMDDLPEYVEWFKRNRDKED